MLQKRRAKLLNSRFHKHTENTPLFDENTPLFHFFFHFSFLDIFGFHCEFCKKNVHPGEYLKILKIPGLFLCNF